MVSDTSRNLRRVFNLSEMLKAQAPKDLDFKPLRVHVIGAGVMGADIAGWCVAAGMQVSLQDLSPEAIDKGIAAQDKLFKRRFKTPASARRGQGAPDRGPDRRTRFAGRCHHRGDRRNGSTSSRRSSAELEPRLKPGAVLASNTSSIMIEDIAEALQDPWPPDRHPFLQSGRPDALGRDHQGTSSRDEETEKGCAFVTAINKFPLIVKSVPGFLVNRVLAPYMFEAFQRLEQGEDMAKIDEAAKVFGMPMGPIELADTVGLDVCAHVGEILKGGIEGSKLEKLVAAGKLGKKSGQGFYTWKDGKPQTERRLRRSPNWRNSVGKLVAPLVEECKRCRDEEVVASSDLVDAGVIFGTGFAPFPWRPAALRGQHRRMQHSRHPRWQRSSPIQRSGGRTAGGRHTYETHRARG